MRKNAKAVVAAFEAGRLNRAADSIWTDGHTIFSYATAILWREGGGLVLNNARYSVTTANHQRALARYFGDRITRTID